MTYNYQTKLSSQRLTTRWLVDDDYKLFSEFLADMDCIKFFEDLHPLTVNERVAFWLDKQKKRYAENRFGMQAIILKTTGEFIGQCGLLSQNVDGVMEVEIGYHLLKTHWHNGYATEAAQLFKNYAFSNNICESLVSIIHINNEASQKVAIRNGMVQEKKIMFFNAPHYLYRIQNNKTHVLK